MINSNNINNNNISYINNKCNICNSNNILINKTNFKNNMWFLIFTFNSNKIPSNNNINKINNNMIKCTNIINKFKMIKRSKILIINKTIKQFKKILSKIINLVLIMVSFI